MIDPMQDAYDPLDGLTGEPLDRDRTRRRPAPCEGKTRRGHGLLVAFAAAAAALLLAAAALGQEPAPAASPADASVRVSCYAADGSIYQGSGTLVDARAGSNALVITNAHVVRDTPNGPFIVMFADGVTYGAKLTLVDADVDLAALEIINNGRTPAAWSGELSAGMLHGYGYGGDSQLARIDGQVVGELGTATQASLELSAPFRHGDSGGGVFDDNGVMRGVIWGTEDAQGVFVHPQHLAAFLARLGLQSPVDGAAIDAAADAAALAGGVSQTQCYGGACSGGTCYSGQCTTGQCYGGQCYSGSCATCPQQVITGQPLFPNMPRIVRPTLPAAQSVAQPVVAASCTCGPKWTALDARLAAIEAKAAVAGPAGPVGPAGPAGPPGKDATIDVDALAAQVAALVMEKLPPADAGRPAYFDVVPRSH